jgi:hypothetical protein
MFIGSFLSGSEFVQKMIYTRSVHLFRREKCNLTELNAVGPYRTERIRFKP